MHYVVLRDEATNVLDSHYVPLLPIDENVANHLATVLDAVRQGAHRRALPTP